MVVAPASRRQMWGGGSDMLKTSELEKELQRWREARARKHSMHHAPKDRRTVRVNGQEVVVVTKPKRGIH
jgi:hypothetical protein